MFVSHLSVQGDLKQTGKDMEEIAAVNLSQSDKTWTTSVLSIFKHTILLLHRRIDHNVRPVRSGIHDPWHARR